MAHGVFEQRPANSRETRACCDSREKEKTDFIIEEDYPLCVVTKKYEAKKGIIQKEYVALN